MKFTMNEASQITMEVSRDRVKSRIVKMMNYLQVAEYAAEKLDEEELDKLAHKLQSALEVLR